VDEHAEADVLKPCEALRGNGFGGHDMKIVAAIGVDGKM
jgi:hypothetical protein